MRVLRTDGRATLGAVRTVYEFDDRFLAPRHGFDGADHYYAETQAAKFLEAVPIPTLIIHACNDPWIPATLYLAYDRSRND